MKIHDSVTVLNRPVFVKLILLLVPVLIYVCVTDRFTATV